MCMAFLILQPSTGKLQNLPEISCFAWVFFLVGFVLCCLEVSHHHVCWECLKFDGLFVWAWKKWAALPHELCQGWSLIYKKQLHIIYIHTICWVGVGLGIHSDNTNTVQTWQTFTQLHQGVRILTVLGHSKIDPQGPQKGVFYSTLIEYKQQECKNYLKIKFLSNIKNEDWKL